LTASTAFFTVSTDLLMSTGSITKVGRPRASVIFSTGTALLGLGWPSVMAVYALSITTMRMGTCLVATSTSCGNTAW
jgi:hypothetical protein